MRLLDLFCGAGGAALGYARAGFEVVGVDNQHMPRFPFEFHQADALEYLAAHGEQFDAIHASPPCQDHSTLQAPKHGTGWMLAETRVLLSRTGLPWVIENVVGAPMQSAVTLCGKHFGLQVMTRDRGVAWLRRHRLFESNVHIWDPGPHPHPAGEVTIGVYGNGSSGGRGKASKRGRQGGWKGLVDERRAVMGIDWMTGAELSQAIPPAYTEYVGRQLIEQIGRAAA